MAQTLISSTLSGKVVYSDSANDAAYRRFDTLEGRADLARRYYAYLVTGVTPAARKQPDLKVVA